MNTQRLRGSSIKELSAFRGRGKWVVMAVFFAAAISDVVVFVGAAGAIVGAGVVVEDGIHIALENFEQDIFGEALRAIVVVEVSVEAGDAIAGGDDGAEVVGDHDQRETE